MTKLSVGTVSRTRFAWFQRPLIVALCGAALAAVLPQRGLAQQVSYYDFNGPATYSGQTSAACLPNSAPSGVLFCFNAPAIPATGTNLNTGASYVLDNYPASVDPTGGSGGSYYALQLTQGTGSQDSSVWYSAPQDVADGFTVWYAFKISNLSAPPGDGLALVIQNALGSGISDPDPYFTSAGSGSVESGSGLTVVGASGGGTLGYGGIDNSIALEADTFPDSYDPWDGGDGDYYDNHMALQSCGIDGGGNPIQNSPAHYLTNDTYPTYTATSCLVTLGGNGAIASNPISSTGNAVTVYDGNPHQVVVVYNGPNDSPANYLTVYLDPVFNSGTHTPQAGSTPLFAGPFNILQYIKPAGSSGKQAYLGFTGATGGSYEQNEIMGFTFTPHGYAEANVCPPGQTTPAPCSSTLPVTFSSLSGTAIGSIQVVTQGVSGLDFQLGDAGTCTGAVTSCTVNVTFAPLAPGLRLGAVNLLDGSNNLLATQFIYGVGYGPATAFGPGTQSTAYSGISGYEAGGVAVDAAGDLFIGENQGTPSDNGLIVKVAANGTQTSYSTSLPYPPYYPQGLAVDGAGNLYIADNNRNAVLEIPAGCNSPCTQDQILPNTLGLRSQLGVAVDGAGDVFISDFLDGEVGELPANGGAETVVYSPGTGPTPVSGSNPIGMAVDAAGDLFIADFGLKGVVEIPAGCTSSGCQIPVGSGWIQPEAVAVDAGGDVFVADETLGEVEVPAGCSSSTCQITMSGTLAYGVALDGKGDLFIPDLNGNRILEINRSQSRSLSFDSTNVGSTSVDSPQSVTVQNVGNSTLNYLSPGLVVTGPNFVQVPGSGTLSNCPVNSGLAPGASCDLSISFQPQAPGNPLTSTAVLTDNSLNAAPATQSISLSGVGLNPTPDYPLSVTDVGSGSGMVQSGDGLIMCSSGNNNECSTSYLSGTVVMLTASAATGSTFVGWGGACAFAGTSVTCNVPVNAATNVSASFSQQSFGGVSVCPGGSASGCTPRSLAVTFNMAADTTIGVIQVVTQGITGLDFTLGSGSTCTGTIAAGNSCNVNVSFTPLAPGLRMGAVELFDNSGNPVAATPIYGIGQGPESAFSPGVQATVPASGLVQPYGLAVDAGGDVFIGEPGSNLVLKVAPGGVQTTLAAVTGHPYGLAVDGAGDVYIAELNNNRVVEVTPSGVQTTAPASGLTQPIGVAVDGSGNIFISDRNNNRVVKISPSGVQTTVPTSGLNQPYGLAVDAAGDVFVADYNNNRVVEVTPSGVQSTVPTTGLTQPYGVAVDAAGDVFIVSYTNERVVEVTPSGVQTTVSASGLNGPSGLALDGTGDIFISDYNNNRVVKMQRSQPPSLSFALTSEGSTSADSPQTIALQNIGNQPLAFSLSPIPDTNFVENPGPTCGSGMLAPGAICSESFSFTPQNTGYLTDTAYFSDNTLNLATGVVAQAVNLSGVGDIAGQPATVIVPNVVGLAQSPATTALTGAGLSLGAVSSSYSSGEPAGSVIGENPAAGQQVTPGSPVKLLISIGEAPPPQPNPLTFENNYFVTGDYASAGVTLRGAPIISGMATGSITIPSGTGTGSVPDGADIIDAFLYWQTLENTPTASGGSGTFLGYPITGQQIGSDLPYTDTTTGLSGMLRAYRADVNAYFPIGANGVRFASGSFPVSLPSAGTALPLTQGASLVVIYRVLVAPGSTNPPSLPLKAVVIYDGSAKPAGATTQSIQGFYDAVGGASGTGESTALYSTGTNWSNHSVSVALGQSNQYVAPLNAGNAYVAEIISTPVNNSDNDGILNAWKTGPPAGDFFAGQPGYYDVKTQSWVPLPGAKAGEKDLFVQLDWMCGGVDPVTGTCTGENLFPSPDSNGNDPLAMVQQAFLATGIHLHLEIGNIVPETTCTDSSSQLCQFPGQPGVIGWKNSLEFSKIWPRNFNACASGGDCTARFPYGQKDSYHYVLMGHSLTIPAWNTRFGTLTGIQVVAGGTTTITTTGIPTCPSRITIGGVLGNPGINGVYNTTGCTGTTMTVATPSGVPSWTYPNTLAEPVIGVTSGTVTSISGYSDLGGADSAVTLALWETAPNQDMSKRANVVAGTLYHEIGHTLGLSHGGIYYSPGSYIPSFDVNCKPNYQSVMNYLFQLDGLGPNGAVAYSNQTLEAISEASLSSLTQLTDTSVPSNPATFPTSAWYSTVAPSSTASPAIRHCDGTPLGSDTGYRVDGSIAPITPSWSQSVDPNIAFDGVPYTTLAGYNDEANIDLRQVGATGGEFASLASVLSFGSSATPLNVAAGGNVTLGAGGTVALGSGGTVTLGSGGNVTLGSGGTITPGSGGSVTLNNGGTATLSSGGTITLGSGGNVTLGSGGNVTLGSGGTITLGSGGNITLGSGGTVVLGSGGTITSSAGIVNIPASGGSYTLPAGGGTIALGSGGTIALGSGGNVTLGSGGTIALGSGGNVTLGSGGTVTLGSGGTIALGSGGTVALGSGGNVTLGSGGTIALGSGGNVTLGSGGNVTLGSGGNVTLGSGGNVTLGSGGNVTLGSGGTVALGSGGNVTLGSGGNVTLGSGGTIALGSGGTVTLGSGGNITLGSGGGMINGVAEPAGTYTVSSGGVIALGSGGTVALGSGGNVTLGSGGTITMGSGGTVTLGSGGNVTLGSGGVVALGSGGTIALGSGGTIALGSGGNVTLGSGGVTTDEMDYNTANSVVRPPPSATYTQAPTSVTVNWMAPAFGVVQTYTISRSVIIPPSTVPGTAEVIGSVSGVNGNPPATTFTDTNPPQSGTLVYTIATTLVPDANGAQRQSAPSPPAMLTMNQNIVLGSLPSSVVLPGPQTVTATAVTNNIANGLPVSFSATGSCSIGSQSPPDSNGVSSASVTLSSTGNCNITASQAGASDYNAASPVSGTFTILPANSTTKSQTITFAPLQAVQYGSTFSLSASSSAQLPVSFTASGPCTTSGAATGVGMCTITASAPASALGANPAYSAASVSQTFNILPATLMVTANSFTTSYGQPLPALTYKYSGFVTNGHGQLDTASVISGVPALSTTAMTGSPVGSYSIAVSTGTLAAANYSFLFVPGTVQVNQASTMIAITSSSPGNTSTFMQAVTFTAIVTPQYGGFTPTGAVTFYDTVNGTTTTLGAGTLSVVNGQDVATFSTSSLSDSAPDNITAKYAGDTNFTGSQTSSSLVQTVSPAPNISLSPLSVAFGNQNVNTTSSPMTITLTNNGDAPLNISSNGISIVPSADTQFAETNNCGSSVAATKSCTISITFKPADTGIQTASLQITDNDDDSAGAQQVISITGAGLSKITGASLYSDAVFATANGCGSITGSGGTSVDSFNSTLGYSSSHVLSGGNVGTNGNVTLGGGSIIYGSAAVDSLTTGTCSNSTVTGDTVSGGAKVTGGLVALNGPVTYPAPPAPTPAPPTTNQNVSGKCPSGMSGCTNGPGSQTVTLAPGSYGNVQLSGATVADLSKGTYNFNSLVLSGGSKVSVVGSGPVVVNLAGTSLSGSSPALDFTGGTMENASGIPANLQFTYAGSQGVNLSGGASSYATVYAPNALVNMSGGANFLGSIVGSKFTISGGGVIHYDSSLPVIQAGNYIWFNAVVNNFKNLGSGQVKLYLTSSTISFTANNSTYNVAVPNAVITLNSASQSSGAKTTYDLTNNRWSTAVSPSSLTGNTFVTGVAVPVPINFPSGIQNVTWSAAFTTDSPGVTLNWQWGAAVYPGSFGSTYAITGNSNVLGVNAEDGAADANGTDSAGTPETYKTSVVFGATGGGGTNYTGYFSPGAGVVPTVAPISVSPSSLAFISQAQGTTSAAMTAVLTNNDAVSHAISSITIGGTNAGDFALVPNGPSTPSNCVGTSSLAAGASCTLYASFKPGDVGTRTAKTLVNDDANNSPQTLYLSGTGH